MKKTYDNILLNEHGQSISLSADDLIDYLLHNLYVLRCEKNSLEKQLAAIRLILGTKNSNLDF